VFAELANCPTTFCVAPEELRVKSPLASPSAPPLKLRPPVPPVVAMPPGMAVLLLRIKIPAEREVVPV